MISRKQNKSKKQTSAGRQRPKSKKTTTVARQPYMNAPVARTLRGYTVRGPKVTGNLGGRAITVSHREYIQDVTGSVDFTTVPFPVNPGRDICFTWLADLASRYERYHFTKLRFLYEPRCATTTAGSVILAFDYDALDDAPTTKQKVYTYHHCAQAAAWDNCVLKSDDAILRNRGVLFTRMGAAPATADLKTYDLANLFLCTSGFGAATVVGELFVEYTVTLSEPQTQSNIQSAIYSGATTLDATHLFGTKNNQTGLLDVVFTSDTITFNQDWSGNLNYYCTGTGIDTVGFASAGSSATVVLRSRVTEAGNTKATFLLEITALRGQVVNLQITATTLVSATVRMNPLD